jgi:hypothetical protein
MARASTAKGAVYVDGLQELRRDLRQIGPDAVKEIRGVIKGAAQVVAADARTRAPRKTGRLANSIVATTSGDRGVIRSPLPYAAVQHWGGTIRPSGTPIRIKRTEFISVALDRRRELVVEAMARGIDEAARRNGWR